jgi:hypothetical protein
LGLYYYRNRYYGAADGRFESEDPLRFKAGDSDLYRYVHNIPNSDIDPSGFGGNPTPDSWKTAGKKDTPVFPPKHPDNPGADKRPVKAPDRDFESEFVYGENFGLINYEIWWSEFKRDTAQWWKGGLGFGLQLGGEAGAGLGPLGIGVNGSIGSGLFFGGPTGFDFGGFASGGYYAPGRKGGVGGAYAGAGPAVFLTNATSVDQLKGPFDTFTVGIGEPGLGLGISGALGVDWENKTFILSVGISGGATVSPVSGSRFETNAVTTSFIR